MKNPKLCVITPVYNGQNFLKECIQIVLNQSYKNIEYTVINDGSTDQSQKIIESFKNLKFITKKNEGQVKTLNKGWKLSNSKYLTYLSADDMLDKNCYEEIIKFMESNEDVVAAFPRNDLIDIRGRIIKRDVCPEFNFYDTLVRQECKIGAGAVFRRKIFDKVGGWDNRFSLCPDRQYWIKLHKYGNIKLVNSALGYYRLHENSGVVKKTGEKYSNEYKVILDEFFEHNTEFNIYKKEAYSYVNLLTSRNLLIEGNLKKGFSFFNKALILNYKFLYPNNLLRFFITIFSKKIRIFISKLS